MTTLEDPKDVASFHHLIQQVGRLEVSIENTNKSVAALADSVRTVTQRQIDGSKPNWSMLAVIATVAIAVGAGLFAYINQPVSQMRSTQHAYTQDYLDHVRDGHPDSVKERVSENREHIAHTDNRLKREMQLLNDSQNQRIDALSEWREKIDKWVLDHATKDIGKGSTRDERIKQLEEWKRSADLSIKQRTVDTARQQERILDIEREIYSGAAYRSGRPIKPANGKGHGEITIHHKYPAGDPRNGDAVQEK